ncbi:MAG TPA: NgoFVII family restriction endonuclease [bacterium]|nr:NgoFVII family restriction endonuclease [bacterium]
MIKDDLFNNVLVKPAEHGCEKLLIVSGYASAAMASKHFEAIPASTKICLIVGMCPKDGIGFGNHLSFKKMVERDLKDRFYCRYIMDGPPVHAKTYTWVAGEKPSISFVGSANYTHNGFFGGYTEVVSESDPKETHSMFKQLFDRSVSCDNADVESMVIFYDERCRRTKDVENVVSKKKKEIPYKGPDSIRLSFLDRQGRVPVQSGLNWGQRLGRDKNQAYLRIPAEIARTGFFPPRRHHFNVVTDDGESILCVIAQDNDKAIESKPSNAILGSYFRRRLGLPSGALVLADHLDIYGRTDIAIYKIDDENYYLDFSV